MGLRHVEFFKSLQAIFIFSLGVHMGTWSIGKSHQNKPETLKAIQFICSLPATIHVDIRQGGKSPPIGLPFHPQSDYAQEEQIWIQEAISDIDKVLKNESAPVLKLDIIICGSCYSYQLAYELSNRYTDVIVIGFAEEIFYRNNLKVFANNRIHPLFLRDYLPGVGAAIRLLRKIVPMNGRPLLNPAALEAVVAFCNGEQENMQFLEDLYQSIPG